MVLLYVETIVSRVGDSCVSWSWNSLEERVQIAEGSPQPSDFLKAQSDVRIPPWRSGLLCMDMRNFMWLCERRRSDPVPSGLRSKVSLPPSPCFCAARSILACYPSVFGECFRTLWDNIFYNHLELAIYLCL